MNVLINSGKEYIALENVMSTNLLAHGFVAL